MKACRNAKVYRGIKVPRCNGGLQCDTCRAKYLAANPPKPLETANKQLYDTLFATREGMSIIRNYIIVAFSKNDKPVMGIADKLHKLEMSINGVLAKHEPSKL